jgi:multicomponent K+:H+ antiporter subunit A
MALADPRSLRRYTLYLLGGAGALGLAGFLGAGRRAAGQPAPVPADPAAHGALLALLFGAVGCAVLHRQRLVAVAFASVVGLIVSLAFLRFSAPDLALTQLSVEVVTIVLLLLSLRFIPARRQAEAPRRRRAFDAAVAGAAGLGVGALAYAMMTRPFETISWWFTANAGGGRRRHQRGQRDPGGFPRLRHVGRGDGAGRRRARRACAAGGAAAPPACALRRQRGGPPPDHAGDADAPAAAAGAGVAFYILLRGHNLPGGGFVAGLITGVALILQYLAVGIDATSARLRVDHMRLFAAGLGLALVTGIASMPLGLPFLTSWHGYVPIPLVGRRTSPPPCCSTSASILRWWPPSC